MNNSRSISRSNSRNNLNPHERTHHKETNTNNESPKTHYYGHGTHFRDETLNLISKIMKQLKYIYEINTNFSSIYGDNKDKMDALSRLQIDAKIEMENAKTDIEDIQKYLKFTLVHSNFSNNGTSLNLTEALKLKIKNSTTEFEKNEQTMSLKEKLEHARKMNQLFKNVSFLDRADEFLKLPHTSWKTGIPNTNVVVARKLSRIEQDAKNKEDLYLRYIKIIGDKEIESIENGVPRNSNQAGAYKNYKNEFMELKPTTNNVTRYRARRYFHTLNHFKKSNEYKNYMHKSGWGANL